MTGRYNYQRGVIEHYYKGDEIKELRIGSVIRIKNMTGEDAFLNGRTGVFTHKFGCFPGGDFGVYLDDSSGLTMDIINVKKSEVEPI